MNTLFERLKSERTRLNLTQQAFADAGGVQRRAQQHYETGERCPDGRYLEGIAKIGADINYIVTGQPALLVGYADTGAHFRAGVYNAQNNWEGELILSDAWFERTENKKETLVMATVHGDLMAPLLQHGETVLFNRADKKLRPGRAYILQRINEKETLIGYVQHLHTGGIRLSFENSNYAPMDISANEMKENIDIVGSIALSIREWR